MDPLRGGLPDSFRELGPLILGLLGRSWSRSSESTSFSLPRMSGEICSGRSDIETAEEVECERKWFVLILMEAIGAKP